jgi:large subunit ribosomal protein L10
MVAELHEKLKSASATVLTDYKGMTVTEMTELRNVMVAEQVEYRVIKNTLMRLASQETDAAALEPFLRETCAIAMGYGDPTLPARILKKFTKSNEKLKIKAGVLGRRLLDAEEVRALADLPTREELLGKLLGTLNAVPTSLVTVLSGVPRAFVGVLAAIQDQRKGTEGGT